MDKKPEAADLFAAIRTMPESGRLAVLSETRVQLGAQKLIALLRHSGGDAPEAPSLMLTCDLLYDGVSGEVAPDAVRLGLWLAFREIMAGQSPVHPTIERAMTIAWNAVAVHPSHRIRMGRRHRHSRAHQGDLRRVFYDEDASGDLVPPKGDRDVSLVPVSRLALLIGYDLGSQISVPSEG